jgi:hypothetical protein
MGVFNKLIEVVTDTVDPFQKCRIEVSGCLDDKLALAPAGEASRQFVRGQSCERGLVTQTGIFRFGEAEYDLTAEPFV